MKKLLFALSLVLTLSALAYAQTSDNATADVSVRLIKPLSIIHDAGDLDFGEHYLTGSAENLTKNANDGARFRVTGHPNRDVTVNFSGVTLDNSVWVGANGGTPDDIAFSPSVYHTGTSSTWGGAVVVNNGGSYNLGNVTGNGTLYLWVGGQLALDADQAQGEYTGTFTISVAY